MLFHIDHTTQPYGFAYNVKWIAATLTAILLSPVLIPVMAIQSKLSSQPTQPKPKFIVSVNNFYTTPSPEIEKNDS